MRNLLPSSLSLGLLALLSGCTEKSDSSDTAGTEDSASGDVSGALTFAPQVGAAAFACGQSYEGVGASASSFSPIDFRMYLSALRLVTEDGGEVAVTLEQDGVWQYEGVALLDFEDATGGCANGNADTNDTIRFTAPAGSYTGVRFEVGVPFELNHDDASVAPSPLNLSSMFWGWNAGYKFLRLEGSSTGQPTGFLEHIGSTGCEADESGDVTGCTFPNRAAVALDGFDPLSGAVIADVAGLLAEADIDTDSGGAPGCMASPDDPDCRPVFHGLGLAFREETTAPPQTFFRLE